MFNTLIKNVGQSVLQDLAVAAGTLLLGHGLIAQSQLQDFEGSVICLGMLALNAYLQHVQTGGSTNAK